MKKFRWALAALVLPAGLLMPFGASAWAGPPDRAVTVRVAHLRIDPGQLEAFTRAVREEMRESVRLEPGLLALYAVADKNDPARLTFFEMYVDDQAYLDHRQTPHFRTYVEGTAHMVLERELIGAVPVELVDKLGLPLDR